MADAHRIVKWNPSLDESARISKPQESASGTSHVCRGLLDFSLLKGEGWPRPAGQELPQLQLGRQGIFRGKGWCWNLLSSGTREHWPPGRSATFIARHFSPCIRTSPLIPWKRRPCRHTASIRSCACSFKCFCNSMQRNTKHCDICSEVWVKWASRDAGETQRARNQSWERPAQIHCSLTCQNSLTMTENAQS